MRIRAYYSPAYAPPEEPTLARLSVAAARLNELGLVEFKVPERFDVARLNGLHSEAYVGAFLNGEEPLASSQGIAWSPAVRDAALAMLGGQLDGVAHALEHGIAMNLARGFHHAVRERGSGFCPLNGLALIAHGLPDRRIFVLDCDEHGGNGTEEFAAELPNLFNVSIFGTPFGCRGGKRSWPFQVRVKEQGFNDGYMAALKAAEHLILTHRPDLIVYQAGTDCHHADPKSRVGLSTRDLFRRDLFVFRMARTLQIPLLFVVAGGYQQAGQIARLNVNTVYAAHRAFSE